MKIVYDRHHDVLTIELKPGPVAESDEEHSGVILDFDDAGELIGVELLDASRRFPDPSNVEFITRGDAPPQAEAS